MTLTEFLTARLDEDERFATEASPGYGPWRPRLYDGVFQVVDHEGDVIVESPELDTVNTHISRHDPARVLREVEAKRRIVEMAETSGWGAEGIGAQSAAEGACEVLAAVYSDHPAYDESWRP